MKPSQADLAELTDGGLGEQVLQLKDEDSSTVVLRKLVEWVKQIRFLLCIL